MSLFTVWPEHPEVSGVTGLHDCTQCAACMCLIYAGFTQFPLGIYTVAERNALDASDDRPDNTGATLDGSIRSSGWLDQQVLNRYGVRMRTLPDDSPSTLHSMLLTPGYAFLLQGSMGNLPVGHPLRRWEPEFGGGHAVCVISGEVRWLDPLAPLNCIADLNQVRVPPCLSRLALEMTRRGDRPSRPYFFSTAASPPHRCSRHRRTPRHAQRSLRHGCHRGDSGCPSRQFPGRRCRGC